MKRVRNIQSKSALYQILILAIFTSVKVFAQTPEQLFETGNSQYAQNNYEAAIQNYEKVLDAGYASAAVYFNLANANYKLNRIAPSIYNYEKALALKPNDKEIKNNLQFAQNMTIDAITPLPQNVFKKWYNQILGVFTIDGWASLTVAFSLLFTLCFLIYYFTTRVGGKRAFFTLSFITLGLGILSLVFTFQAKSNAKNREFGVVFSSEAEIKNEPNMGSEQTFILHEGTKVRILEEQGDWQMIRLADGKEGWIPKNSLKII